MSGKHTKQTIQLYRCDQCDAWKCAWLMCMGAYAQSACVREQIVEDDITADGTKVARRTGTSDKVAEGRAPGAQGGEGGKAIPATAVKILLPALKELLQGMGTQYDLLKEVVAAVQVRPRPSFPPFSILSTHTCWVYYLPQFL